MKQYFLAVGELSDAGTFPSQTWICIYRWFQQHVNSVLIYSWENEVAMRCALSEGFWRRIKRIEPFRGEPSPLFGYCLQMQRAHDWIELGNLRISPDNGVTHLYFYRGESLVGDIQIDDGVNFLRLYLDSDQRARIASENGEIENSRMLCDRWRNQISQYAGREEWEAI